MKTTQKIIFVICLALTSITYTMDDKDTDSSSSKSKELVVQKPRVPKRSSVIDLSSIPEVIKNNCLSRRKLLSLHFLGLQHAGEGKVTQPAMIVPLKKELTSFKSYYNSREYSDNMITALNNLRITLGITLVHQQEFDTETSQKYMNLNIQPIEKLIQEREKEKYDEILNTKKKKYKEKIKEAEEQKEKVTKQQTLKNLSFWRRHPKLTYTLGIITGGFICGFGTYYAHDTIAKIFGKTVEASLKTAEVTVETAAQS